MVHYPHYAAAMAVTGDYDLVCCGHEHRPEIRRCSNIKGGPDLVVNPGTVGGVGAPKRPGSWPTWMTMVFEVVDVSRGRKPCRPAAAGYPSCLSGFDSTTNDLFAYKKFRLRNRRRIWRQSGLRRNISILL